MHYKWDLLKFIKEPKFKAFSVTINHSESSGVKGVCVDQSWSTLGLSHEESRCELVFTAIPNESWLTSHSLGLQYSSYYMMFDKLS